MGKKDFAPVATKERTLTTSDLFLIWFGAAIAITEIWAGGSDPLRNLGLILGLVAIVIGRVVGNGLMAAMARIGADTGLPTMVLTRPAFGIRGSYLPAICNVLQLIGWTGWMLFVGYLYLDTIGSYLGLPGGTAAPEIRIAWIVLLGLFCTLWAMGGRRFWQLVQRVGAALLLLLTIALTVIVLQQYNIAELLTAPRGLSLGVLNGADLVIAMSVSWLPLVADYSRYATKPRAGAQGTFWGYFVGGTWMYAVGLLVALAAQTDVPDQMVVQVMSSQGLGWAIAAVVLVLLSTVTTTFLDIFSTVVSSQNLTPGLPDKAGVVTAGVLGVLVALVLNVDLYEPFLIAIGAIFLPAFTVVLTDYYLVSNRRVLTSQVDSAGGSYWYTGGFNLRAILAWAVGFTVYDWAQGFASVNFFLGKIGTWTIGQTWAIETAPFAYGASLPCILVTTIMYLLIVRLTGTGIRKKA